MKNYSFKNFIYTWILSLIILTSCDYSDVNQDPTRPGGDSVDIAALIPAMQTQSHRNLMGALARHAGIIMQQFEGSDAQQLQFTVYNIGEDGPGTNTIWQGGFYTGALRDAHDVIGRASEADAVNNRGIAKIYMALNLGMATDTWGDIPYSQAFMGEENPTPRYDRQEDVFASIQSLLSEAVADLMVDDLIGIQGNLISSDNTLWIKTAHALKARYFMQLTRVDNDAASKALTEVALALEGNSEQLDFVFENTQNGGHPLALFELGRPNTLEVGRYYADLMENDPRKDFLLEITGGGNIRFSNINNLNLVWGQLDSSSPVISFAELKFIEAEALVRTGGNGLSALQDAVKANMEYLGVSASNINSYIAALNLSGSTEAQIETIITEKYKALFGNNAIEAWTDFRRTGYPQITAVPNGSNGNNPSGIIPRRLLYPQSERLGNPDSFKEAVDRQGGHLLDVDLWAFPQH